MENINKKRKIKKVVIFLIAVLFVGVFSVSGVVLAKYYTKQPENKATNSNTTFYLSSDYLTTSNPTYSIPYTQTTIEVYLYNYEPINTAQVSQADITYTTTFSSATWSMAVTSQNGTDTVSSTGGTITDGALNYHKFTFTNSSPNLNDTFTISITSTSPYTKTLSATFTVTAQNTPTYTITNYTSYVEVEVNTHNYTNTLTINWDSTYFAPDNTNPLMTNWLSATGTGTITCQAQQNHKLIFFKNSVCTVSDETAGSGTTISIQPQSN